MSTVRFATLCDFCGKRSEEYTSWPSCKCCQLDTCPDCDVPSERTEDEYNRTYCKECEKEGCGIEIAGIPTVDEGPKGAGS